MSTTILITSAGRRVGLVECFRRAASRSGLTLEVLACDVQPDLSPACRIADQAFVVPRCDDPSYVEAILEIVERNHVSLVIPTIDPELEPLARAASRFAHAGARVHVSPPDVIKVARDKHETATVLSREGVQVPWTIDFETARRERRDLTWPLFMKPSSGSSSRGLAILRSLEDLPESVTEPMVLQELLVGPEYTTNIFIDSTGVVRSVVSHERIRVRAGEVEKGRTERRRDLEDMAHGIARALPSARGALCFQTILDRGQQMKVFEINARFGGGYPLADHAGAEFALWLLQEVRGVTCTAHNDWREGVLMLRYDAAVFHG